MHGAFRDQGVPQSISRVSLAMPHERVDLVQPTIASSSAKDLRHFDLSPLDHVDGAEIPHA